MSSATDDANVAPGATLTVQAAGLLAPARISASTAAPRATALSASSPVAASTASTGGAGNDGFFFGADGNLTGADRSTAATACDSLALRGNYVGVNAIVLAGREPRPTSK